MGRSSGAAFALSGDLASYAALAGATMAGALAMADNELGRALLKDYAETTVTVADAGAATTIDLENGNVRKITLTVACTLTFSNPPATGRAGSFTLFVVQGGTGSYTITWPVSVQWPAGTAPTLTTAVGGVDMLVFTTIDAGTTWYGLAAGLGMA